MTDRDLETYKALRATVGLRGTVRICAFLSGLAAWALLAVALAFTALPLAALVPLVLLAGTFEAVFALHTGAERIGRYLEVFHEDGWEAAAAAFGPPMAGTGSDPLFAAIFGLAATCNLLPVLFAGPVASELAVLGAAHALFLLRVGSARRAAGRQRDADRARFQQIRDRR